MDKRLVVCTLITAGRLLWSLLQWLLVDWGALKVWWQGFDYKITELLQATFLISNSDRISRILCIRCHQMWNRDSSLWQQHNFNLQTWLPNFQSFFTQLKIILKTTRNTSDTRNIIHSLKFPNQYYNYSWFSSLEDCLFVFSFKVSFCWGSQPSFYPCVHWWSRPLPAAWMLGPPGRNV